MEIKKIVTGTLDENCYVLIKNKTCLIVDPGDDYLKIKEVIADNKILGVLITNAVGNGIESAAVSDAAPYQGDTVTFTAALKPGATWHGWYGDASCTQLVSSSQTYTRPAADLTLYAKATIDTPSTGVYIKANGTHREAQAAYKKINGVWVKQTDAAALKNEMKNMNLKLGG